MRRDDERSLEAAQHAGRIGVTIDLGLFARVWRWLFGPTPYRGTTTTDPG